MRFEFYFYIIILHNSKNSNPYFFREFIRELSRDLKQKPKQSLSGNSGRGKSTFRTSNMLAALAGKKHSNTSVATHNTSAISRTSSVTSDAVRSKLQKCVGGIKNLQYNNNVSLCSEQRQDPNDQCIQRWYLWQGLKLNINPESIAFWIHFFRLDM